jgi:hypothetical protein
VDNNNFISGIQPLITITGKPAEQSFILTLYIKFAIILHPA